MAPTPIIPLDNVKYNVLAVSALTGDIQTQVQKLWQDRFQRQEAFWVNVHEGQTTNEIASAAADAISQQGVSQVSHLLITVFLDLTQPLDKVPLDAVFQLQSALSHGFHALVPVPLVFAYTGKLAFANDLAEIRQRCAQLMENKQTVYLVGIPSLGVPGYPGASVLWKASILLTDIMRRQTTPMEILPSGELGYIRYGEYNEDLWHRLNSRRCRLERELSGEGEVPLTEALQNWVNKLREDIRRKYSIDARYQPIHPGMAVSGFLAKRAARKGKNEDFSKARLATLNALVKTGEDISRKIREDYRREREDASPLLQMLLDEADAGLALKRDRMRMHRILDPKLDPVPQVCTVNLAYCAENYPKLYQEEMGKYLTAIQEKTIEELIRDLLEALRKAYQSIPESAFQDQERTLSQELKTVKSDMQNASAPSREQFVACLQQLMHGSCLPVTPCNPTLGGGASSHIVLCRTQEDAQGLDDVLPVGTQLYCLDHTHLKEKDSAPIKGIQVFAYSFTEARLKDLMG